jgi:hypothetical protein
MRCASIVNSLEVTDILPGGMSAVFFDEFGYALHIFSAVRFRGK